MKNRIRYWINKMSKLLDIETPKVIFIHHSDSFYSLGVLHIHLYDEYPKTLFLALHELRHYYQEYYMNHHNNDLAKLIHYEMEHYNLLDYRSLFIERDAYSFAYYCMLHLIHIDYKPSLAVKEMILDDFLLILNDF